MYYAYYSVNDPLIGYPILLVTQLTFNDTKVSIDLVITIIIYLINCQLQGAIANNQLLG